MDEQAIAAVETRTYRFSIERLVQDANDCWQVVGDVRGEWDYTVLEEFLKELGQAGRYRVIRYAGNYCDMVEFNVAPVTTWTIDRVKYDEAAA